LGRERVPLLAAIWNLGMRNNSHDWVRPAQPKWLTSE
jgi:hypothetical protein